MKTFGTLDLSRTGSMINFRKFAYRISITFDLTTKKMKLFKFVWKYERITKVNWTVWQEYSNCIKWSNTSSLQKTACREFSIYEWKNKHDKQKKKLTNNNNETVCMCHSLLQFSWKKKKIARNRYENVTYIHVGDKTMVHSIVVVICTVYTYNRPSII